MTYVYISLTALQILCNCFTILMEIAIFLHCFRFVFLLQIVVHLFENDLNDNFVTFDALIHVFRNLLVVLSQVNS